MPILAEKPYLRLLEATLTRSYGGECTSQRFGFCGLIPHQEGRSGCERVSGALRC